MAGDSTSFRNALVLALPRLRRFALSLTQNRDAAEDLVQSTVTRALQKWQSYDEDRKLDSWLFKIMQNLWYDMRRSAANGPQFSEMPMDVRGEDGRATIESRTTFAKVSAAFAQLSEEQRTVMTLVVLEGMSYAAAAEVLQVPIGTIMSRLARARSNLLARMEPESGST